MWLPALTTSECRQSWERSPGRRSDREKSLYFVTSLFYSRQFRTQSERRVHGVHRRMVAMVRVPKVRHARFLKDCHITARGQVGWGTRKFSTGLHGKSLSRRVFGWQLLSTRLWAPFCGPLKWPRSWNQSSLGSWGNRFEAAKLMCYLELRWGVSHIVTFSQGATWRSFSRFIGKVEPFSSCTNGQHMPGLKVYFMHLGAWGKRFFCCFRPWEVYRTSLRRMGTQGKKTRRSKDVAALRYTSVFLCPSRIAPFSSSLPNRD